MRKEKKHSAASFSLLSLGPGFNSGFGLKDTWLSSLPRLQVGKGAKRNFSHLLPTPPPL